MTFDERFELRLATDDKEQLDQLASEAGLDKAKVLRLAIRYMHTNRDWSVDYLKMKANGS